MEKWEKFELECTEHLKTKFGSYASFQHQGGADSTVPDIYVQTNTGKKFYIDVKLAQAQCGQFVLIPNLISGKFDYSELNQNPQNTYASAIMDHMNLEFDAFRDAGTAGKDIIMNNGSEIFAKWIVQIYKDKGAMFFITEDYTILPVDQILSYFEISAKYRIKRSGSSNVGSARIGNVKNIILSDYTISNTRVAGTKLFVSSNDNLHNKRFIYEGYEYMFSQRGDEYEIRKCSNTYNANVIFSIKLIKSKSGMTDDQFISYLK